MSEKITILPLDKMTMQLKYDPFAKKHYIEIGYAECRGVYRFMGVYPEDIPSGEKLQFSDIAKLAAKKEEEHSRLQKA